MSTPRRLSGCMLLVPILIGLLATGCRTVPQAEYDALEEELEAVSGELENALESAEERAQRRENQIAALEEQVAELERQLAREEADAASLSEDLELALQQLGTLREERLDLQEELLELTAELERLHDAAAGGRSARGDAGTAESAGVRTPESGARTAPDALGAAFRGADGFDRVRDLGLRNDPRATARFAQAAPGIGVDTAEGVPLLYDARLDYEETLVYLAIADPEGRPRLRLTAQHLSEVEPLYLQTAFITIEGGDPVDPLDPIVLSGTPVRETDGTTVREALVMTARGDMLDRLSTMIGSRRFTVTFLGSDEQITHRPSVAERAAMSNMLFAYLDLRGER